MTSDQIGCGYQLAQQIDCILLGQQILQNAVMDQYDHTEQFDDISCSIDGFADLRDGLGNNMNMPYNDG
jgi:hypothetical protein